MSDSFTRIDTLEGPSYMDEEAVSFGNTDPRKRQRIQVGGSTSTELARVRNSAPSTSDYGLVVRVASTLPADDVQKAIDTATAGTVYVGRAARGVAQSATGWTITRIVIASGLVTTQRTDEGAATWNNRTTETYS